MRRLGWLITGPLALALIAFAIANRRDVILSFDPFSVESPALAFHFPLWAIVFATFIAGLIFGGMTAWALRTRNELRRAARKRQEIKTAEAPNPLENVPAIATAKSDTPPTILQPPPNIVAPRS
jgi:uncharacterized integral membrane protein